MDKDARNFVDKFFTEAPYQGIETTLAWTTPDEIPWFNRERYERGRKYFWLYRLPFGLFVLFSVFIASGVKPVGRLFHKFGYFNPKNGSLLRRFLPLCYMLNVLMSSNIFEAKDVGTKYLRITKCRHIRAAKKGPEKRKVPLFVDEHVPEEYHVLSQLLRETGSGLDTSALSDDVLDWDADPLSAFYFNLAYLSGLSLVWLNPVGSRNIPLDAKKDMSYAFAVFARQIPGLRDEDNVFLNLDEEKYRTLFSTIVGKLLAGIDPTSTMFFYQGLQELQKYSLGMFNAKAITAFFIMEIGLPVENFRGHMSPFQRFMLRVYESGLYMYMEFSIFRGLCNLITSIVLRAIVWAHLTTEFLNKRKKGGSGNR